jgi:anti-sigma B factor antagonist
MVGDLRSGVPVGSPADGLLIWIDRSGSAATVRLAGYLDLQTAPELRRALGPLISDPGMLKVSVDAERLTFCDACGISPLIKMLLELRSRGGSLTIMGPGPSLRRLLGALHLTADFGL